MLVTLLGIVIEVRESQLWKVLFPIFVMLLGRVTEVRVEAAKAASPMLVTLLGMKMEVRAEPAKAQFPMLVTLLGMVMEVR